jgi:hypothetical protein
MEGLVWLISKFILSIKSNQCDKYWETTMVAKQFHSGMINSFLIEKNNLC